MVTSENAVPPWSVCPFAVTLARVQSTLNSLETVYTDPGLESLFRPSPWLAGRDRGPWLEFDKVVGKVRRAGYSGRSLKEHAGCRLKTARGQGASIPVLIILVQTRHAASRPAASIAWPTALLPLCPRNFGRGLM